LKLPAIAAVAVLTLATSLVPAPATAAEGVLAHDVYFALKDPSKEARAKLVEACKKYLTGHEGTVSFAVGTVASELAREVNDRDFDVALHIYFKDKAAHDKYQAAPRHTQFIEEQQANWKKVRVFDSWVETK
jgi:hypothetical protein